MSKRIFLSYARNDGTHAARQITRLLEGEGLSVWQDLRELSAGETVWPQIASALKQAEHLIVVVTSGALDSDYIRREWREARRNGASVFPVLGEDLSISQLPRWIRRSEVLRLDQPESLSKFLSALRSKSSNLRADWDSGLEIDNVVERPQLLNTLRAELQRDAADSVPSTMALYGQGGFGKSVIAGQIARDAEIRDTFIDGVFWIDLGLENLQLQEKLGTLIARLGGRDIFNDLNSAAEELSRLLEMRDVLLIVDNAWRRVDLEPFVSAIGADGARLLITTQNKDVLPRAAQVIDVGQMSEVEALEIVSRDLGPLSEDKGVLKEFVRKYWCWPQLMAIANGILVNRVRDGASLGASLRQLTEAINSGLVPGEDERNGTISSVMQIAMSALTSENGERLKQLAVLPKDVLVPLAVLKEIWNVDQFEAEELASGLVRRALLQSRELTGSQEEHAVRIHGNVQWFLDTTTAPGFREKTNLRLLSAFLPETGNWEDLPSDLPYLWRHLFFHLERSEWAQQASDLRKNYYWMKAKLEVLNASALHADYVPAPSDTDEKLIGDAIGLAKTALSQNKADFSWQIWGRLSNVGYFGTHKLLEDAKNDWHFVTPVTPTLTSPGTEVIRFYGHEHWVRCVAFILDSKYVISGSRDKTVRKWDIETGEQVGDPWRGHEGWVLGLASYSDGRLVVSASRDGTLQRWDAVDGKPIGRKMRGHKGAVRCVAVSQDGATIASGSNDGSIRLWNATTGESLGRPLRGHSDWVYCLAFSPNSTRIVSGSKDTTLRVWDVQSGRTVGAPLRGHTGSVRTTAFSPCGSFFLSGSEDCSLRRWDATTLVSIGDPILGHEHPIWCVDFSPNGNHIVSGSYDRTLRLWDPRSGKRNGRPIRGHHRVVTGVGFSSDSDRFVSCSDDRTVRSWAINGPDGVEDSFEGHLDPINGLSFSSDGSVIASASNDKSVRLWNAVTGKELENPKPEHGNWVRSVSHTRDGRWIVSASTDGALQRWSTDASSNVVTKLSAPGVWTAVISTDDRLIASGSFSGKIWLWNTENFAKQGSPLIGHSDWVTCLAAITHNRLASGSRDGTLLIWDLVKKTIIAKLIQPKNVSITSLAISSDGNQMAVGFKDGSISLWEADADSFKELDLGLAGHHGAVWAAGFSPCGQFIASGSDDEWLKIWSITEGRCVRALNFDAGVSALVWYDNRIAVGDRLGNMSVFMTS